MSRSAPLAALLALAACGPPDPQGPAADDGASTETLPDTAMVRDVSPASTLELVAGDVLEASPSVAIQTIDLWIARLDTVSAEGVAEVRGDLETLRNQLQSSPIDGAAVGRSLGRLGEGTAALAEPGTPLGRLAETLRRQGARLVPDTTATDSTAVDSAAVGA